MKKYTKYLDTETEEYFYEMEMKNGSKFMVEKELGDYVHFLERKVKELGGNVDDFLIDERVRKIDNLLN
tara:strand:- start:90263 stop:90469 length:207 start_codon:yes stop_codon:yes gene_type:complete